VSDALNDGGGFYHINFLENGSQRGSITSTAQALPTPLLLTTA
jgi:hypothetical protein